MKKYAFLIALAIGLALISGCVCGDLNTLVPPPNQTSNASAGTTVNPPSPQGGCTPSWTASEWGGCSPQGLRTRTATDLNGCGTLEGKPEESESCNYVPVSAGLYPWDYCKERLSQPEIDACIESFSMVNDRDELTNKCNLDGNDTSDCINYFKMCIEIVDKDMRNSCIATLGTKLQNYRLCSVLLTEEDRMMCTVKSNPSGFGQ